MNQLPTIKPLQAIKKMRVLTEAGIPFSFQFLSYNESKGVSEGFKLVVNAQLRKSYRNDQSNKSKLLVGYKDHQDSNRWFYLPLLTKFNGHIIKP